MKTIEVALVHLEHPLSMVSTKHEYQNSVQIHEVSERNDHCKNIVPPNAVPPICELWRGWPTANEKRSTAKACEQTAEPTSNLQHVAPQR